MSAVLEALRASYFQLASKENYPNTPKETKALDQLEAAIREEQVKTPQEWNPT